MEIKTIFKKLDEQMNERYKVRMGIMLKEFLEDSIEAELIYENAPMSARDIFIARYVEDYFLTIHVLKI